MGFDVKYEEDFYAWTREQAARLRDAAASGANLPLDWENLAEEIESMGRSDRRGIISRLGRVIEHLLKLEHSPAKDPRPGWERSVLHQRHSIEQILSDSPSLRGQVSALIESAWKGGRRQAALGLEDDGFLDDRLPRACPYTVEQILDPDWWPVNHHGLD